MPARISTILGAKRSTFLDTTPNQGCHDLEAVMYIPDEAREISAQKACARKGINGVSSPSPSSSNQQLDSFKLPSHPAKTQINTSPKCLPMSLLVHRVGLVYVCVLIHSRTCFRLIMPAVPIPQDPFPGPFQHHHRNCPYPCHYRGTSGNRWAEERAHRPRRSR